MPKGFLFVATSYDSWDPALRELASAYLKAMRDAHTPDLETSDKTKKTFYLLIKWVETAFIEKMNLLSGQFIHYYRDLLEGDVYQLSPFLDKLDAQIGKLGELSKALREHGPSESWFKQYDQALRNFIETTNDLILFVRTTARLKKIELPAGSTSSMGENFSKTLQDFYNAPLTIIHEDADYYEKISPKLFLNPYLFGWKMHISVVERDVQRAYEICMPVLSQHIESFKIISPVILSKLDHPLRNGAQITLYLENNGEALISREKLLSVIKILNARLREANITCGMRLPDITLKDYEYFGVRNDLDSKGNYISADTTMGCYNVAGTKIPAMFAGLLPDTIPQQLSLLTHFQTFNPQTPSQCKTALCYCLQAFLNNAYIKENGELLRRGEASLNESEDKRIAQAILSINQSVNTIFILDCHPPAGSVLNDFITAYNDKLVTCDPFIAMPGLTQVQSLTDEDVSKMKTANAPGYFQ